MLGARGCNSPASAKLPNRSEEHTSELQSRSDLVCRLLLEKKKKQHNHRPHTHKRTQIGRSAVSTPSSPLRAFSIANSPSSIPHNTQACCATARSAHTKANT